MSKYYAGRSAMFISCLESLQHPIEEEEPSEPAIERCYPESVETPSTTKSYASNSLTVVDHERNLPLEIEQRLAMWQTFVEEFIVLQSLGQSRPLGMISSALEALRRREELENQLARLKNLAMKQCRVSGEDLMPTTPRREGPVRLNNREQLQLLMDKRRAERIRHLELRKMLRQAQELDLAFLVDATSSMASPLIEVKNLVPKIATDVKKAFPKLKMRMAFVPYRDYAEHDQDEAEKCDFTDSFEGPESTFVSAIAKVQAIGGGDTPEDVLSGLERVVTLRWKSKTRVLIHIADMGNFIKLAIFC